MDFKEVDSKLVFLNLPHQNVFAFMLAVKYNGIVNRLPIGIQRNLNLRDIPIWGDFG